MATISTNTMLPPAFQAPLPRAIGPSRTCWNNSAVFRRKGFSGALAWHGDGKGCFEIEARRGPLCELIDGTLVEKTVGVYESWLALRISHFISTSLESMI